MKKLNQHRKTVQATTLQLFRCCLILAWGLLASPALYSQSVCSRPYAFTNLAGLAGSYGSADGAGSNARFYYPRALALDSAGIIYVADTENDSIRKITPAGVVSTLAGLAGTVGSADGTGANARFSGPSGVAVDSAGTVYVADTYNCTLRKITPAGVMSTLAGLAGSPGSANGTGANARFKYPYGVAADSAGNLYVADSAHTIRKITPAGVVSTLAGLAGSRGSADGTGADARFNNPYGLAVDSAGNVYVADSWNNTIRKITPGGVVSTLAGLAGSSGSADGTGANARFGGPSGVAVDSAGNLYVADTGNQTIRMITPAGVVSTLAGLAGSTGSADGTGSQARFHTPCGVAVDSAGNSACVADHGNSTIRLGRIVTVLGITLAGANPRLSITGEVGTIYEIQYLDNLAPTNAWLWLTNLALPGNPQTWVDMACAATGQRFYRAVRVPTNMVLIPAGSFVMGNCMDPAEGSSSELPLHTVYVSGFYMDQYLVTSNLWFTVKAWNGGNGYSYENAGAGKRANHPVQMVHWFDVVKWCNARSQMEGLTPCYYTDRGFTTVWKTGPAELYVNWGANGYRLPTEAEWEKAARGGVGGHRFPWSDTDNITHSQANYSSSPSYAYDTSPTRGYHPAFGSPTLYGMPFTSPVESFAPNGYGLYDMAGNVFQFCWDYYDSAWYSNPGAAQSDTRGPSSGSWRVVRGGSWGFEASYARCAYRIGGGGATGPSSNFGFRCVRGL